MFLPGMIRKILGLGVGKFTDGSGCGRAFERDALSLAALHFVLNAMCSAE